MPNGLKELSMKKKSYSYFSGIKNFAPQKKSYSEISTVAVEEPDFVYVPTKQMKGPEPVVVVTKGDNVKIGSRVAISGNSVVYSPVSGMVERVEVIPSVFGGTTNVVVIANDHKKEVEKLKQFGLNENRETLKNALKAVSIVDYDGVTVLEKLNTLPKETQPILLVNLVSDEPFVYSALAIVREYEDDCVQAIKLMANILDAKGIKIAVNSSQLSNLSEFINKASSDEDIQDLEISVVPDVYPLGDEVELVQTITKKKYSSVTQSRKDGFVAFDIFTLFAVKKLLIDGEAVSIRPISIIEKDGDKISSTLVWVKMGTTVKDLLQSVYLNGSHGIRKIVAGGPMRGIALGNEEASITFSTKAIMAIRDKLADKQNELPCIGCGKCKKVCPAKINPAQIDECTLNRDFNEAVNLGANKCTKCGCCSFVCPSKRFLTQRICYAKEIILSKGIKNE